MFHPEGNPIFRRNIVHTYIMPFMRKFFYNLKGITKTDKNTLWCALHQITVIKTLAVSQAMAKTIKSDSRNHDHIQLLRSNKRRTLRLPLFNRLINAKAASAPTASFVSADKAQTISTYTRKCNNDIALPG